MTGQASLFDGGPLDAPQRVDLDDGDVLYFPCLFPSPDRDRLLEELDETTVWRQETIKMYGKESPIPRLTAWHGDPGRVYTYSKIAMEPLPWTEPLREIKDRIEQVAGVQFNSVLLNLYRDGSDGVAWHSDDEPELGPVIGSVSFGASRKFQLRHKDRPTERHEIVLEHGSFLLMRGATQRRWQHQVPKTATRVEPRINLTFRSIG